MADKIPEYHLSLDNCNINLERINYPNPYDYNKVHRHHYYELFFFEKGGGSQVIDFKEYELNPKGIYLVCPGQIHLMKRNNEANGLIIQFKKDFIIKKKMPWHILFQIQEINNSDLYDDCHIYILELEKELNANSKFKNIIVANLLENILLKILAYQNKKIEFDEKIMEFIHLIESHYKEWRTVSEYYDSMELSAKKLSILSKKHLGRTPLQVLHRRMLLEAKRLMATSEKMSLKEIAYELKFDNPSRFSNFIKKMEGIYPSELQAQLKKAL